MDIARRESVADVSKALLLEKTIDECLKEQ